MVSLNGLFRQCRQCGQGLLLRTLPPVPSPLVRVLPICSLLVQGLAFSACTGQASQNGRGGEGRRVA